MAERIALLPSNATALEKAFSEALDRTPELSPGIVELRGFKFHPIDRVIPYLVAEYGLSEVAEFLPNLRDVIREGIQWQRIIGTPAAIHKSLRWINHDGDIEEFPATARKWWWFQIHLPFEPTNTQFLRPTTQLVQSSKPLRSEFARLTAGWDVRAFRLNEHRLNGGAGLNTWSGTRKEPGGPVVSIRVNHRKQVIVPTGGRVDVKDVQHIETVRTVQSIIPMSQHSTRFASLAAVRVDYRNRATVAFQNAPFVHQPFGAPVPRVQTGFE
ncbi:phage tail protein [Brucella sp. JSBI001]|uniref:phage tail protein n=1 Tax=Brucella sp. JSBI001 TaxID=2886044 RepID=UPI00124D9965|nr:phage tail protein [Brucella sp. JSBI001]KAB2669035.1 phage tail protein [Ochrobactrum sp. LMG 5442]UZD69138.1 phage tail protein [Brucella sp. JSBI001]